MEAQLQYILDLAKQFKPLIDQSKLLFEALNQLPKEELLDIYAVYGDPDSRFQPVNVLRAEISRRLLEDQNIDEALVEEIKQRIRDKDKEYFSHLSAGLLNQLTEYQIGTRDMFANWQKHWTVFHVFFYKGVVLETTQLYLQQIAMQLLVDLDLKEYQYHYVDFYGANNFGSEICWIALYPDNKLSHKDAYQFFSEISTTPKAGKLAGWEVKDPEDRILQEYKDYQEVVAIFEKLKPGIAQLNHRIRNYFKFAPGPMASEWDRFFNEGIVALSFEGFINEDLKQYQSLKEINNAVS